MLDLFERRERWQLAVLFFVTLLMAFVQVLGVVSVMPFMALLASPGLATEHEWLRWAYEFGGFESTRTFTFAVGAVVLVVFTVSNGLAAFTTWLTFRFTEFAQHNISRRLLARYLSEPYVFFLDRHTSTLNYRIQTEVPWAVNGYVLQVIQMMTRGSVAVALLVLLLFVNAVLSLIVAVVLGGSYLLIYWLVRDRQQRTGAERAKALSKKYKIATESLAGIKEARVLGREPEFLSRFTEASWIVARNSARGETIAQMPRYAVETLGIGGVVLIALYLLGAGQDIAGILPILSLYALAGYRILPALQLIYSGAASVRFSLSPLYALHKDLIGDRNSIRNQEGSDAAQDQADTPLPFRESIRLSSVWYRYPGSTDRVINDASMSITRNTSIAFVGPTGSGKTTIVDILLGLLPPDKGAIYVDDHRLTDRDLRRWRRLVGYVPQDVFLADDTISRNIAFGLSDDAIDMDAVRQAAAAAHADEFIGSLPEGYDTLIGERGIRLSGGQRQRIGIARALYHQPEVLIMDEATSALDGSTEQQVMDAVRGLGRRKTIILIAHRLTTVEHCDVIYVLDRGFIVDSGTYQELMQRSNKFRLMARARASE